MSERPLTARVEELEQRACSTEARVSALEQILPTLLLKLNVIEEGNRRIELIVDRVLELQRARTCP